MKQKIKLHTVNVVRIVNGEFRDIHAFADNRSGNKRAETLFGGMIRTFEKSMFGIVDEEDFDDYIEDYINDGIYEHRSGFQLLLVHSA